MQPTIRILIAIAILVCFVKCSSQSIEYVIQGKLINLNSTKISLEKYTGKETSVIKTVHANADGSFVFTLQEGIPVGFYKVSIGSQGGFDIIFNNSNIAFTGDASKLEQSLRFINSSDNLLITTYLKDRKKYAKQVEKFAQYEKTEEILQKNYKMEMSFYNYVNGLLKKYPNTHAAKLITINREIHSPDYEKNFFSENGQDLEKKYLKEHFFDNVNFMDESLIRGPILYYKIRDFFSMFLEEVSNDILQQEITRIMHKAGANNYMNDFVLRTIYEFLEKLENFEAISWLAHTHSYSEVCTDDVKADAAKTIEKLKALAIGKPAPAFNLHNENKVPIKLYDIKAKYTLLVFWSITCEHCLEMIPELKPVYDKYKSNGFELVTISFDQQLDYWMSMIEHAQFNWINLIDYEGNNSSVKESYNVVETPKIMLLDSEKKIVAKLYDYEGIVRELNKDFGY